jgi:hypothetical protein
MKILVIICGHEFSPEYCDNIKILKEYLSQTQNTTVEYCGITNSNTFHSYEHILTFKYKIVDTSYQLSKICNFITTFSDTLEYDWFIKFRPDLKLLEPINFNALSDVAINARARVYNGPRKIKFGMSINGEGAWRNVGDCKYDKYEHDIILDDHLFIFHNNVIKYGAFNKTESPNKQDEWGHSKLWKERNIPIHVIGINLCITKYRCYSGDVNV